MLVRNPKKRPSASKMLSVRTAHKLLLSLKCVMMINVLELCFSFCCPQVARKSVIAGLKQHSVFLYCETSDWLSPRLVRFLSLFWTGLICTDCLSLFLSFLCFLCLLSSSVQHMFLTQQCLNQELTLDLLEKFRNPEKLKSCLMTEDEEMEVGHDSAVWRQTLHVVLIHLRLRLRPGIADSEWILLSLMIQRWRCRDLWRGSSLSTNTTGRRGRALT